MKRPVCVCASRVLLLLPGDFWDRRGDLPVIPLNTIQQEMAAWEDTPLLLLPGNHDQVGSWDTHIWCSGGVCTGGGGGGGGRGS